jgi:hypothetical protein
LDFYGTIPAMLTIKYSGADGSVLWQKRDERFGAVPVALALDASGKVIVAALQGGLAITIRSNMRPVRDHCNNDQDFL